MPNYFNIDRRLEIPLGHSLKELEARRDHLINRNKLIHIRFLGEEIWVGKQKESLRTHCLFSAQTTHHITEWWGYLFIKASRVSSFRWCCFHQIPDIRADSARCPEGVPSTGKCGHSGSLWGAWSLGLLETLSQTTRISNIHLPV